MIKIIYRNLFTTPIVLAIISVLLMLKLAHLTLVNLWGSLEKSESVFTNDHTYVMHQALKNKNIQKKTIVFVGGSVTREGTLLDIDMQKLFLHKKGNGNIQFLNLGSSDQSLLESLRLLKTIRILPETIVYIQFSFKKLNYSYAQYTKDITHPRLPMLSSAGIYNRLSYYDTIIHSLTPDLIQGKEFWNFFIQNKNCNFVGLFDNKSLCYRNNPITRSIYKEENIFTIDKKHAYVEEIKKNVYPEFIKNCNFSADLISETIDYVIHQGGIPILIEYPISNTEKNLYRIAENNPLYKNNYRQLAKKALVLDIAFHEGFIEEDFFDSQHLLPSGKTKVSNIVTDHAISILNGDIKYELP